MLGSVKYFQQRSMHQYNQNIDSQCYSHGRLSQQEQGSLKAEATGNSHPPSCHMPKDLQMQHLAASHQHFHIQKPFS